MTREFPEDGSDSQLQCHPRIQKSSRRQPFIQLGEERLELVSEDCVRLAEAALLAEPAVLKIIRHNLNAGCDVLRNMVEPFALLGRERVPGVALRKPGFITRLHFLGIRHKCAVRDDRVPHKRDKIGKLRELSPLWEMHLDGIDLSTVQWAAH